MPGTEQAYAPYASPANVLAVIHRLRQYGLPEVLTIQELNRLSIPEASASRTLTALKHLRLINEEGRLTPEFQQIGKASKSDYPTLLSQAIKVAYSPVFTILDPAQASEIELTDAFRLYEPRAQRTRMIALFLALCQEAGLVPEGRVKRSSVKRPVVKKPIPATEGRKRPTPHEETSGQEHPTTGNEIAKYPMLLACISSLPKDGKWTTPRRARWINAVTAAVDFIVEVVEADEQNALSPDVTAQELSASSS
jgi:hypothetical protein